MYEEQVKRLRDKAKRFDYDGWIDTAAAMEKAADAIEELTAMAESYKRSMEAWAEVARALLRWIPVTERLPESFGDDVLVTDGEGCAVGFWREDAQAWDSTDFGWLENRSEPPCGIHTVTHWMPLPELPKEESDG